MLWEVRTSEARSEVSGLTYKFVNVVPTDRDHELHPACWCEPDIQDTDPYTLIHKATH